MNNYMIGGGFCPYFCLGTYRYWECLRSLITLDYLIILQRRRRGRQEGWGQEGHASASLCFFLTVCLGALLIDHWWWWWNLETIFHSCDALKGIRYWDKKLFIQNQCIIFNQNIARRVAKKLKGQRQHHS